MIAIRDLATELRNDARLPKLLPAMVMGPISGINLTVFCFSTGLLIFSGPLAPYAVPGVGLLLFGSLLGCLLASLFSGYRGATAGPPLASLVVFASVAPALDLGGEALFATMAAVFGVSALATGICFLLIGRLKITSALRFIPYPVSGGFLAGVGGVSCLLALPLIGLDFESRSLRELIEPAAIASWAPGMAFGVGLLLAAKRWRGDLIVPGGVLAAVLIFHLGLHAADIPLAEAKQNGFLLPVSPEGGMWPSLHLGDLSSIFWPSIAGQAPQLLVVVLLNIVSLVLYLGSLELSCGKEVDWDGEFTVAGTSAVPAALGAAPAACLMVVPMVRHHLTGADTRLTGLFVAVLLGLVLAYGNEIVSVIPAPVVGGIMLYTGLNILDEWIVRTSGRLPRTEFAILLAIFISTLLFGFLEAMGIGMLVATVLFVFHLSRLDPIAKQSTVRDRRSRRNRSIPDQAVLREEGMRGKIYCLHGYVFFGSAYPLFRRLEEDLAVSRSVSMVLDLHQVSGFDFSAVRSLCGFLRKAHAAGWQVIISGTGDWTKDRLAENLSDEIRRQLVLEPDLDRAIERCEDEVIDRCMGENGRPSFRHTLLELVASDMEHQLDRQAYFENIIGKLEDWIELHDYEKGEAISGPDKPPEGLRLLMNGQASTFDASGARLRQYGPGDPVNLSTALGRQEAGPVALADRSCQMAILTPAALQLLEETDAELAFELYRYLMLHSTANGKS